MIYIEKLHKNYRRLQVLKGINLQLEKGLVYAIVGPNGSGKTTLIKAILGLVQPQSGEINILGQSVKNAFAYRKHIGYMPQSAYFPENLSVSEIFQLIRDLRGNPANCDEELLELFQLTREFEKSPKALSGGTRQKVSAVIAFLFNPQLLILDEPTAGLDPVASSILKNKIQKEKENGRTIIITSHIMSELEMLADKIVFLLDGVMRFHGSLKEIREHTNETNLERAVATIMQQEIN
ncbi:ABC transporter ATP-binding protein [candidate division KSB1 bacterium]|nr:ABC transporter ATP-binding protein [candidate division KSB1 bacterium]